ncbi:hypothetical protein [Spirosoma aerolatum]|uniref:hypothetical protein n=1 Tax=Spirosoma aerolatum TaxID=1211326 RepID=UPI0009ADA1E2|nr:hypothetical protein [Spirosoma aerolatum]
MKNNLLSSVFVFSLVLFSLVSYAQQRPIGIPEERATRQTARMKDVLTLSPEQEISVADINLKYAKQAQSLMETGGRNLKTMREAKAMMKSKDKEMKEVLTKDQYKQYEALRDEMRSAMRERRRQ